MRNPLLIIFLLFFAFSSSIVKAGMHDAVVLNKAYIKTSMGIAHFTDNNNITAQSRDSTFPNAKYDLSYESAQSYSVAVGNKFDNTALEMSFDYIEAGVDSLKSDTLRTYSDGDISTHSFIINGIWYPEKLSTSLGSLYIGAGIGTVFKVDLDQTKCTGARCLAHEGFKSATDEYQLAYQFLIGAESKDLGAGFSLYTEIRNIFFDNIALGRDKHNETFNNMDINVMAWNFGIKWSF
tara:strand:- start:1485 stop:2195 length:711 start_codon:yes stop_codon:yes gene_type:complete